MNPPGPQLNRRILIVDDNPSIHDDFREILCSRTPTNGAVEHLEAQLFGQDAAAPARVCFELDSAFQGREALGKVEKSLAEQRPYALAFVDVRMPPGWDGLETIARIWEICPALQVVVCTAYADYSWEQMRAKVRQPDSLVILKKPFDNIEVQQLAHALTKKWWLNLQSELRLSALSLSEERFSQAFHQSPIPSAIQNLADQRFLDVNERLAQIAAIPRDELIGRTPAELSLWDKPAAADQWYQALLRGDWVREQSARIVPRSGAPRELLVSLSRVTMTGQPQALLLAQDVSERVLLERQLRQAQKMEAIGQLAAGVAHDFNNILTVIQGHAGLLRLKQNGNSAEAKSVEQIAQSSMRAATLVRQLLMFSRKQVMQFRHLDLNEVLRNAIKMLERLVGEHVEITFRPDAALPAIHADSSMIEQIVMNLAVNARDAMPNGGRVTITTTLRSIQRGATPGDPEPREGEFVCLSFSDTGTGMDTQVLSRIFEPFFTTKPPGKGTGLGLSTVFGIVRQHQGWVEVDSRPERGSTFRVYLPASPQAAEKLERVSEHAMQGGHETVLVAEDEEALRQMVVHVLRTQGYKVLEASSGRHALEVWERANCRIDLLMTDMVMPGGIMGSELAERLTEKSPALKVIYTSGYSPGIAGKDLTLLEGQNFLAKPYRPARLLQAVRDCLDRPAEVAGRDGSALAAAV